MTRHARFTGACRRDQDIEVSSGPPGVGKTLSARHYARWKDVEDSHTEQRTTLGSDISPDVADGPTLVSTPKVATTPRHFGDDLVHLSDTFNELVRSARQAAELAPPTRRSVAELLIVDEADRLKMSELEEIRDRRVLEINRPRTITNAVVETAPESLDIGP